MGRGRDGSYLPPPPRSVRAEVPSDNSVKPLTHDSNRLVTSALQLIPNSQQRRTHSLLDRQSQYLKTAASVGTATVREAQEVKRLRFT